MSGIKDLIIAAGKLTGVPTLDFPRIEGLSVEEFRAVYIAEMEQFIKDYGKNPICSRCSTIAIIDGPNNLIRYLGENLHFECFKKAYSEERGGLSEREQRYLDLVSRMVVNVPTRI